MPGLRRTAVPLAVARYDKTYAFCLVGSGKAHRKSTTFLLNRKNRVKKIFIAKPFDE